MFDCGHGFARGRGRVGASGLPLWLRDQLGGHCREHVALYSRPVFITPRDFRLLQAAGLCTQ